MVRSPEPAPIGMSRWERSAQALAPRVLWTHLPGTKPSQVFRTTRTSIVFTAMVVSRECGHLLGLSHVQDGLMAGCVGNGNADWNPGLLDESLAVFGHEDGLATLSATVPRARSSVHVAERPPLDLAPRGPPAQAHPSLSQIADAEFAADAITTGVGLGGRRLAEIIGLSEGGSWVELGGSASSAGISGPSDHSCYPSVVIDSSDNPVVAWDQIVSPGQGSTEIYVKRWDGSARVEFDGSGSGSGISGPTDRSYHPSVAIDGSSYPVVAWDQIVAPGQGSSRYVSGSGESQGSIANLKVAARSDLHSSSNDHDAAVAQRDALAGGTGSSAAVPHADCAPSTTDCSGIMAGSTGLRGPPIAVGPVVTPFHRLPGEAPVGLPAGVSLLALPGQPGD